MTKHTYYPASLNIQIGQRLLAGESATLLQNEFHIPSSGTIYTWKKWYITHELNRVEAISGRPQKIERTLEQEFKNKSKEFELLKKFFSQERW